MTLRHQVLKGTAALSVGQGISSLCTFIRFFLILSFFLDRSDFGIAGFFALTIALLDMISNLSLGRLIIQSEEGDDPSFQAMSHVIQVARGLFGGVMLYYLSWPVTDILLSSNLSNDELRVLDADKVRLAFQFLAIVPVVRGFAHLDPIRFHRELNYTPSIKLEVIPQVIVTIIALPLAIWLHNYWAMLWLLIARWSLIVIGSHLLAERPYRWGWNKAHSGRILSFGWPLLVNGFLMFLIFQGDKLLIGLFDDYTIDALGIYTWGAMLTMQPGLMFLKVLGNINLPVLSRAQHSAAEFSKRYALALQVMAMFATWYGIAFIIAAGAYIEVFYPKYQGCAIFIGWLAATQAFRIMRAGPTIAAMAKADTQNLMISNMVRASGFGLALIACYHGAPLKWVAIAGFASEVMAMVVSVARTALRQKLELALTLRPVSLTAAMLILSAIVASQCSELGLVVISVAAVVVGLLALAVMMVVFKDFRRQINKTVGGRLDRFFGPSAGGEKGRYVGKDDNSAN